MKNFDEIYDEILQENKDVLEKLRKKHMKNAFIEIMGLVIGYPLMILVLGLTNEKNAVYMALFMCIFIVFVILMLFLAIIFRKKFENILEKFSAKYSTYSSWNHYTNFYKEKVVKRLIKACDESLFFEPEKGISGTIYDASGFNEKYDRFSSEDCISGNWQGNPILMSEVFTQKYIDSNKSETKTVFHGMFCYVKVNKAYPGEIKIFPDKQIFSNKNKVTMDSNEFERYFDVYADNKIEVMQFLTSDIMEKLIDFASRTQIQFEIIIRYDKIFIRFRTGSIFEANQSESAVDYMTLKKIYDLTHFTFAITQFWIKAMEDAEI